MKQSSCSVVILQSHVYIFFTRWFFHRLSLSANFRQTPKMKILFTICLTISVSFAFGQFAIIYDKDSFCNVRSSAVKGNNIIDKLENGHFVYCLPNQTYWTDIDYSKNKRDLNGQVYKDLLIFLSKTRNMHC